MNDGDQRRLTWDEALSRPYESAWSTFVRVCTLNALAPGELVRLIARSGHRQVAPGKTWKSEWVDLDRYGVLLGVASATLRTGFLDQLGFALPKGQAYAVRHCPKCWESGYHCALFDLVMISACPWHGVELRAPCVICATTMPRHVKAMNEKTGAACPACGLRFPNARDIIHGTMPLEQADEIRQQCDSLVLWKQECDNGLPSGLHLLGSVGIPNSGDRADAMSWQLGLARAIAPARASWSFAVPPASVHVARVDPGHHCGAGVSATDNAQHDLLCKALRRNVYKRYVRRHRACLHQLTQFTHNELPPLKGNVCTTALAYLAWHMRMKQTCNIDGLRVSRQNRLPLRIETPPAEIFGVMATLMLLYSEFFGLWFELENRCGRENFDINLAGDVQYRYAQFAAIDASVPEKPFPTPRNSRLLIAYPWPQALAESAAVRCGKRKASLESMTNASYTEHIGRWCWSSKTGRFQRRMFQVRDKDLLPNGVAAPLLV